MTRFFCFAAAVILLAAVAIYAAGLGDGNRTVAVAGTPVQLSPTSIPCQWVLIQADLWNAGNVYIGASTVTNARGLELRPGDTVGLPPMDAQPRVDLNEIYVDAANSKDGVRFVYQRR